MGMPEEVLGKYCEAGGSPCGASDLLQNPRRPLCPSRP